MKRIFKICYKEPVGPGLALLLLLLCSFFPPLPLSLESTRMQSHPEGYVITLKLTAEQYHWLENAARFISDETGSQVSHGSIMMRLMENGLPHFEQELQALRARANAGRKRFPRLQLVQAK